MVHDWLVNNFLQWDVSQYSKKGFRFDSTQPGLVTFFKSFSCEIELRSSKIFM